MLESCKGLRATVKHQDVDPVAIVVLIYLHAKVVRSVSVDGTFVVFIENACKMFGVLPPNVLDAKVIDTESE